MLTYRLSLTLSHTSVINNANPSLRIQFPPDVWLMGVYGGQECFVEGVELHHPRIYISQPANPQLIMQSNPPYTWVRLDGDASSAGAV